MCTNADAKHTGHVRIRGFGVSPEKALFVLLDFSQRGKTRMRLLPLTKLSPTSGEFDRLNVDGARLISQPARHILRCAGQPYLTDPAPPPILRSRLISPPARP